MTIDELVMSMEAEIQRLKTLLASAEAKTFEAQLTVRRVRKLRDKELDRYFKHGPSGAALVTIEKLDKALGIVRVAVEGNRHV